MPTIREVAARAGVSPTTVSHVINNTRFVSPEARERVLQAMEELGYRPNVLARSLRRGETRTLGLILPDSANPFFAEVARAIEDAAFREGYNVILGNSENELDKERLYVEVLTTKQVDGLIFVAAGDRSQSLEDLMRQEAASRGGRPPTHAIWTWIPCLPTISKAACSPRVILSAWGIGASVASPGLPTSPPALSA